MLMRFKTLFIMRPHDLLHSWYSINVQITEDAGSADTSLGF